ncbi:hypothetical protein RchiOBHm_Chr4g0420011 [Rosa chinensis]|uniref:Uncharacterized protein n=1 Tax=Rosa chinensis TaxID=74649 RepID=A0A2P6QXT1_ROSCH|nr:hypothetical protein RchiOBHm_Chr4g0420011 [Rosa chinensis]
MFSEVKGSQCVKNVLMLVPLEKSSIPFRKAAKGFFLVLTSLTVTLSLQSW